MSTTLFQTHKNISREKISLINTDTKKNVFKFNLANTSKYNNIYKDNRSWPKVIYLLSESLVLN